MPRLSREEFLATFGESRDRVGADHEPPIDFWPYFDAIPALDFEGRNCSEGHVENVWRTQPIPYEHVLVNSDEPNVFMVIVIDVTTKRVLGHRLLDLRREYGLG